MVAKILLCFLLPCVLFMQTNGDTRVLIVGKVMLEGCHEVRTCSPMPANQVSKRNLFSRHSNQSQWVSLKGDVIIKGCYVVRNCKTTPPTGSKENPAASCKAIKQHHKSAKSGVYYIKTDPIVTKVYCYMEDIPGCGGGGWTTVMKTDGTKKTFRYSSHFWSDKKSYKLGNGQSGVDNKETKLPTYWTLPFKSLCLGMKTAGQKNPRWIRVEINWEASSLYSMIADGKYRKTAIGRNKWKSLIAGSSLQTNCNKEGFNVVSSNKRFEWIRIGMLGNNENDCATSDSSIGFGGDDKVCGRGKISTGNCAGVGSRRRTTIKTHGYILVQ